MTEPKYVRLTIVVDVHDWYARGETTPESLAERMLTADGEYDMGGVLVSAEWKERS